MLSKSSFSSPAAVLSISTLKSDISFFKLLFWFFNLFTVSNCSSIFTSLCLIISLLSFSLLLIAFTLSLPFLFQYSLFLYLALQFLSPFPPTLLPFLHTSSSDHSIPPLLHSSYLPCFPKAPLMLLWKISAALLSMTLLPQASALPL